MRAVCLFVALFLASARSQDAPPAGGVPSTAADAAPAERQVAMEIPITTPAGNRTLTLYAGEDVRQAIKDFTTSEGLGEAEENAILSYVVNSARKPALSLPITTPNGERVLALYEGQNITAEVIDFCNREGLGVDAFNAIISEIAKRAGPKAYAMTVPVQIAEGAEGLRVLHLFDGDRVADRVLQFCNSLGLGQEAFDAIVAFVQRRMSSSPLMELPFTTPSGTQILRLYPEDVISDVAQYFVHALQMGAPELQAVTNGIEMQVRALQRDQYNSILDQLSTVYAALDKDDSGVLSPNELAVLDKDGSCDFYEFVATRSGNLTNVTAASAGAMDDAISAIVKRHAAFGADGGIDKAGLEAVLKGEDLVGDAERLFAALDADNSTSLSVSELGGIKGAIINRAKGTRAFKSAVTAFARADSDHNGELTLSEAGYVVPDSWTDTLGASAFSDMDLDGDGVCTFTEFAGAAMSQSAVHAASNFSKGAIEKTDDGSALFTGRGAELAVDAYLSLFRRYDANRDGVLDETEQVALKESDGGAATDAFLAATKGEGGNITRAAFRDTILAKGEGQAFVAAAKSIQRLLVDSSQKGVHALTPEVFAQRREPKEGTETASLRVANSVQALFARIRK